MKRLEKARNILEKALGKNPDIKLKEISSKLDKLSEVASEIEKVKDALTVLKKLQHSQDEVASKQLTTKDLSYIESILHYISQQKYPKPEKEVRVKNLGDIKFPKFPTIKIPNKVELKEPLNTNDPDDYPINEKVLARSATGQPTSMLIEYKDFSVRIMDKYTPDGDWDGSDYTIL